MNFILQRLYHTKEIASGDYTCGFLFNDDDSFRSFLLEDTHNENKIAGVTRIPAGIRELKLRKEDTPLTIKHRSTYDTPWFEANPGWYHIEVTGIPNYTGVYIHSGNDDSHTLGCLLPNFAFDTTLNDKQGSKSLAAVDKFYSIVYPLLLAGKRVFIDVRDEIKK
jgi:Family of unknown function (DUF5675)